MPPLKTDRQQQTGKFEFVALFAFLTSLTALAMSMTLPAMAAIGQSLSASAEVHRVVSMLVLGMVFGEIFFGPLADARGRKVAILAGISLFIVGSLVAFLASSMEMLLFGRLLQGFGVAGPKIGSRAAIRDRYAGDAMASTLSLIMTVLVIVPMLAPVLGERIVNLTGWRSLFIAYVFMSSALGCWLWFRQPETLAVNGRIRFSLRGTLVVGVRIVSNTKVLAYTLSAGLLFGAQLSFYGVAQAIFSVTYSRAELFTSYFALLALAVGVASLLNAKLVLRLGSVRLVRAAVRGLVISSAALLVASVLSAGVPHFWVFFSLCTTCFFSIGVLFGNLGSMAMESLGSVAGIGASVIASVSSLVAVLVSDVVGRHQDNTIAPLSLAFVAVAIGTLILVEIAVRQRSVVVMPYEHHTD